MISDKVERAVSSCIYFLLPSGNVSSLHRIPCAETWHFYVGEPITVCTHPKPMHKEKKKSAKFTTSFTAKYYKLTIVVVAGKNKSRQKRFKVATFAHTINLKRWDANQPLIPLFR